MEKTTEQSFVEEASSAQDNSQSTEAPAEAYYHARTKTKNVLFVLMIGTGMLAGGAANGVIATTLAQPSFVSHMSLDGPNSSSLMGGTNGTFYAGGFLGVFFAAWASDRFGRKSALWVTGILNIVSCVLCAASVNITMFIVVRFFAGFSASQYVMQTPMFQSEIAPPHLRGILVGTMGMFNTLGYNVANWSGVGFYYVKSSNIAWRMIFVIVGGLTIFNMVLLYFVPESPRWLVMKGRLKEAEEVLHILHGDDDDDTGSTSNHGNGNTLVEMEILQIERQIAAEKELSVSYYQMFADPRWRRRTLLCAGVGTLGQCTGVLVINNYGPYFYSILGMSTLSQLYLASGYVLMGFIATIIGAMFIDKLGRVNLMIWGVMFQVVVLSIECAIVAQFAGRSNRSANIAGVFAFFLYELIYALTWDCTPYVYVSEIMPSQTRAKGVTLTIACLYASTCALVTGALYAFSDIGWKYFLVFICLGPVGAVGLWMYAPETKGKTLEEIGGLFGDTINAPELHTTNNDSILFGSHKA